MKIKKYTKVEGLIRLVSGLHIGAGNEEIHIGGIDNPVIKNPINGTPYIPGSSIKGKMRCLLEQCTEKIGNKVDRDGACSVSLDEHKEDKIAQLICKAFGNGDSSSNNLGPARIIFRDCMLTETSIDLLQQLGALTESKTEVSINRRTGTSTGGLRQVERVPSGAEFRFEVIIKEIDDDKDSVLEIFKEGIKLLEMDCLGGSGSRGYGRVEFVDLKYIEENININENH